MPAGSYWRCLHTARALPDGTINVTHEWYVDSADAAPPSPGDELVVSFRSTVYAKASASVAADVREDNEARYGAYVENCYRRKYQWAQVEERGEALLLGLLDEAQRECWRTNKYVDMTAPSGYRYRLGVNGHSDLYWIDESSGHSLCSMCIYPYPGYPGWSMPIQTIIASQFLALCADEVKFIREANGFRGRKPKFDEAGKAAVPQVAGDV